MVAAPLNAVAAEVVCEIQAGGIRGRKMTNNIINLECKAMQFMITNQLLSGIFALDQAAAFPSISRKFIHWIMKKMGVPKRIRTLLKALYTGGKNGINFGGRTYHFFVSGAGVKQGDPAAMITFVLCFDPILRWISSLLSPLGDHLFGYCDDVGIVCRNLLISWPIMKKCFIIVGKVSGLFLNTGKTQCGILFDSQIDYIVSHLCDSDKTLSKDLFKGHVKYLGVFIGPTAHTVMWNDVIDAYKECVQCLRGIDAGFTSTMSLYNILCVSICSWIGSFVPPSKELLRLEAKSLQRLTHGPWNVFPIQLLFHAKCIGYPTQFQSIDANSIASRVRNGCATTDRFPELHGEVNAALTL